MAEQLANLEKDSGMLCTKPTYWNTAETWTDGNKSYYVRNGNLVTVFGKKSSPVGTLFTLPVGYRPVGFEIAPGTDGNGQYAFLMFYTDGTISAYTPGGYIWATGSFYTADPFPYSDL